MSKVFLIDLSKCSGCHSCQVSCKDEFCEQPWLPYSDAQPLTGHFWCRVDEKERGRTPVVTVTYKPVICNHCERCALEATAPDVMYRRDDGLVIIDPEKAKGRRDLVDACPLGVVYWNEQLEIPQKCTGCAHLLDDGWTVPRCVDSCAHGAIRYAEESELNLEDAEFLPEVAALKPRVYYKNLPKRFIAGCVYDATVNDIIEGAHAKLVDADGNLVATAESDCLGDWKFDQIEQGAYAIRIEADGYEPLELTADTTDDDQVLGDFTMKLAESAAPRAVQPLDPPRNLHNKVRKPVVLPEGEEEDEGFVHLTLGTKIREIVKYPEAIDIIADYWPKIRDADVVKTISAQTIRQVHNAHSAEFSADDLFEIGERLAALKIEAKTEISVDRAIKELAGIPEAAAVIENLFPDFLANEEVMSQVADKSFAFLSAIMPDQFSPEVITTLDEKLRELNK